MTILWICLYVLLACSVVVAGAEQNQTGKEDAGGEQIFYDIYTDEEKKADPKKEDTGLFFFRGNPGEKFAVLNAE